MNPEVWVQEYAASQYLREQSDNALQQRYEALTSNLWSTDAAGNVTAPRNSGHRQELLRLITHVLCEQSHRAQSPSISLDEGAIRRTASAAYQPPKLKTPFVGSLFCFAKFGRRDHVRNAFENGVLRVAPASAFDDPSLNAAQRDNELLHWTVTPNEQLMVKLYGKDANGDEIEIPVQKKELFRGRSVLDFYVWCCGLGYEARLFYEFQAEAVLVIRDMDKFRSRFAIAMEKEIPGWTMKDGPLAYYDPYNRRPEQLVPIYMKNIRYLKTNIALLGHLPPGRALLLHYFLFLDPFPT